ncbi:MAG: hypothetical protein ACXWKP_30840 [Bradyrhizobium sp.]
MSIRRRAWQVERRCYEFPGTEKDFVLLPRLFRSTKLLPIVMRDGEFAHFRESVSAMKAQLARFAITLTAMLVGLIAFMGMDAGWIPAALIVITGFVISEAVYRRFADQETLRRDLEERVRNQHL